MTINPVYVHGRKSACDDECMFSDTASGVHCVEDLVSHQLAGV